MSYTWNTDYNWTNQYYSFLADNTYIKYWWANKQITYFDWWAIWDYVNICWARDGTLKPNKIYVNINQVGNNWWAWYKIKLPMFWQGWNYYNPTTFIEPTIVSDGTNWFTQSWVIEFEIPEKYWNYWNLNWKCRWYSWQIIIENLWDTVTPMIADIRQIEYWVHIINEWTEWDELNFEKIHNYLQTIDTSLSIKNVNQYFFNCSIRINGWYFKSLSEQVTFWRNFDILMYSYNAQYWQLVNWKAINWCSLKFSCYNGDFGWYIAYTGTKIYWLDYEMIYEPWSIYNHWHWWARLWWWNTQDINWLTIANMRSVSMTPTSNVVLNPRIINTHIEPLWAIIDWWITINYTQWIRTTSSSNFQYVHNYDFTAVNNWAIQNRASWRYADTQNFFVDCKFNTNLPYWHFQVYWSWTYLSEQKTNIVYSMIMKVTDNQWIPIPDANVTVTNWIWDTVFTWATNADGYANNLNWSMSRVSSTLIEDTNAIFPASTDLKYNKWLAYEELMMTSGDNKEVRKIIKKSNTTTICYPHTPYLKNNNIWDRFIKVPYITALISQANPDLGNYNIWIDTPQWPFTLTINKWDYKYSEILDIKAPVNKVIVLKKQKTIINTDLENLN